MSANRSKPHIYVLPEDDANRQLANGFLVELGGLRQIQVLPEAGGWMKVLACYKDVHMSELKRCPCRTLLLLVDFDGEFDQRLQRFHSSIGTELLDRVFVLGVSLEPESLKSQGLGSYEHIGHELAIACRENIPGIWDHELLRHNMSELARMRERVRTILFPS